MRPSLLLVAAVAGALTCAQEVDCTGVRAVSPRCQTNETLYHRDIFFVGGNYAPSGTAGSDIFSGQLYVEKLTPADGLSHQNPLVFISAGVPSGTVWLNTPDNRRGWASYFVDAGYPVYIVDITGNGRSSQNNVSQYPSRFGSTDTIHQNAYTAPELLDPYPQSQGHVKWPGNGTRGDPIFDAFFVQTLPLSSNAKGVELAMRAAGCELLSLIGPSYLLAHSAGATYSTLMSEECPSSVLATLNLEPGNVPFQSLVGNSTVPAVGRSRSRPWGLTNTPIGYDPPITNATKELEVVEVGADTAALRSCFLQSNATGATVHKLVNIAKVPYIMFTAPNSPHITYDHCFVSFLEQAGVRDVRWVKFGELGIQGNGHFSYLETNNLELARVVEGEIQRLDVGQKRSNEGNK